MKFFLATWLLIQTLTVQSAPNSAKHRYVATFSVTDSLEESNAFETIIENLADELGDVYEKVMQIPFLNAIVINVSEAFANRLIDLPFVKNVEIDHKVSVLPPVNSNRLTVSSAEQTPYGIDMVGALDVPDSDVGNVKVCIVDSGYDISHPDLPKDSVSGGDNLGAGPWDEDGDSHGTHVAGTIAAIGGNDQGVVGVNRNGKLPLHIVRIFDDNGDFRVSNLLVAAQSCADAGATIISMSLGQTEGPSDFERTGFSQFYDNGILLVAAAGNDGNSDYSYPASYDSVISVSAIDQNKDFASRFSQFNDQVDLAAPGVGVLSTVPGGSYESWDGTSMACPHVSGVAALVWSRFPDKTNVEIREALINSAEDLGDAGYDISYGHGLVRADLAVDRLLETGYEYRGSGDECVNTPADWVDSLGYGCNDFYTTKLACDMYGDEYADSLYGKTANEVCCTCAGGSSGPKCVDDNDWKNSLGMGCEWYDSELKCRLNDSFGDKGAADACCLCKDATYDSTFMPSDAGSASDAPSPSQADGTASDSPTNLRGS